MDGGEDAAGVAVEAVCAPVIADAVDQVAGGVEHIDVGVGSYLAGHHHLTGGDEGLDSHMTVGVAGKELVKKSVAYLVGHLIGMSFRYGLGSK